MTRLLQYAGDTCLLLVNGPASCSKKLLEGVELWLDWEWDEGAKVPQPSTNTGI